MLLLLILVRDSSLAGSSKNCLFAVDCQIACDGNTTGYSRVVESCSRHWFEAQHGFEGRMAGVWVALRVASSGEKF